MIPRTLLLVLLVLSPALATVVVQPQFGPREPPERYYEPKPRNPIIDARQLKAEALRKTKKKRACPRGVDGCKCPGTKTYCFNGCTDLRQDPQNCGDCGLACADDERCVGGICECKGTMCPGLGCTDLQTDKENCGTCGVECGRGAICENGACICLDELKSHCDQGCTNMLTDALNCGGCNNRCAAGAKCVRGKCQCRGEECRCSNGRSPWCGGCTHTRLTDPKNCGSCGSVCSGGQVCDNGHCECPDGHAMRGGVCVAVMHELNWEL